MNNDDWARFGLEIARDRALNKKRNLPIINKKYECLNCWGEFEVLNSHLLKPTATQFCNSNCEESYKNNPQEIPILDGTPRDFIRNDGLEKYEPDCYSVNPEILKQAETYESKSKYDWDCFRFFVLLNKTRSGQFKNKWGR